MSEVVLGGYDPSGLRVRRSTGQGSQLFHLEGEHLEAIYTPAGSLRAKYLRGAVVDEVVNGYVYAADGKPTNFTFHHDQVTSVVALTGHSGTPAEASSYAPFGESLSGAPGTANTLRYTGRERDPDTGLYYYRARFYDPSIGRFLSEDPLGFGGGDINLYAYVGNNPLNRNDPSGMVTPLVTGAIGAAGAALGECYDGCSGLELALAAGAGFVVGTGVGALAGALGLGGAAVTGFGAFGVEIGTGAVAGGASDALVQGGEIFFNPTQDFSLSRVGVASGISALGAAFPGIIAFGRAGALAETGLSSSSLLAGAFEVKTAELVLFEAAYTGLNIGLSEMLSDPAPYPGPPDDFNPSFDYPSTNLFSPLSDAYCFPKC